MFGTKRGGLEERRTGRLGGAERFAKSGKEHQSRRKKTWVEVRKEIGGELAGDVNI